MFFEPRKRPLELEPQRVLALRPSLNTPVVDTSDLPVGPACAAILVHKEPGRGVQISIGVRSLGCGSVTVYALDVPIGAPLVNVALDAALSFAESMGFLFDDDMVDEDAGSQQRAVLRWQEMIGDALATVPLVADDGEAAELFEVDGGELTDPPEPAPALADEAGAAVASATARAPALALTKFRLDASDAKEPAPARAEEVEASHAAKEATRRVFGRMRLVKRTGKQPVRDARRAWLLKLLTSF